jgi:N-methylhydantoinase B/oxoprolinase/acetone carboxylase alpha subunit
MGASAAGDGLSGVQVHMTNTLNTPVEALEIAFPFRVRTLRAARGKRRRSGYNVAAMASCASTSCWRQPPSR